MNASDELAAWNELMNKFRYDSKAVMDIQEQVADSTKRMWEENIDLQKFALEMGYIGEEEYYSWLAQYRDDNFRKWSQQYNEATLELKKYSDSFYDDAVDSLDAYEKEFTAWYEHSVKMGELSVDEQIAAQERFAEKYNAMVSGIVATASFGSEETAALWNMAYKIRHGAEETVYSLGGDMKTDVYENWEKDMKAWIDIHNTYNDWEEIGDSLVSVYDRCIERQKEFLDNGIIGWQEWHDASTKYSLLLYEAAGEEYDRLLKKHADSIAELEEEFEAQRTALRERWEVEDRTEDLSDIRGQIAIYKNAATYKGQEYYADLLEKEKQLVREEQLYKLEKEHSATLDSLYADYEEIEASKERILAGIRNADLTTARCSGDISYSLDEVRDIASAVSEDYALVGFSSLEMLENIYLMLNSIKKKIGGSAVYNDSRNISIGSGLSDSAIAKIINGTIVSGLGTVLY